nr:protein IQ-DOMAIN 14-like [Ipomoea batatas]
MITSSAETEISLAFSSASWRMKRTICWICLDTSASFIVGIGLDQLLRSEKLIGYCSEVGCSSFSRVDEEKGQLAAKSETANIVGIWRRMGKAVRWLKGLLGIKKDKEFSDKKVNKRWSFGRLSGDSRAAAGVQVPGDMTPVVVGSPWRVRSYLSDCEKEQNKHAIAVAAAVVKLTSQGKGGGVAYGRREKWAAVKKQEG